MSDNLKKYRLVFCLLVLFSQPAQAAKATPQFKSYKKCDIQVTDFQADYSLQIPDWALRQLADSLASFLDVYFPQRFISVYRTGYFDSQKTHLKLKGIITGYYGPKLGRTYPIEAPVSITDNIWMSVSVKVILGGESRQFRSIKAEYMIRKDEDWEIGPLEDLINHIARQVAVEIGREKYRQ
ncbi:MAG: hypothetical protein ACE5GM_04780 [bacterium]